MSSSKKHRLLTLKDKRSMPGFVPFALASFVKLLACTYRVGVRDPEAFLESETPWPAVFLLWHNRIISLPGRFPKHLRKRAIALISQSRDGEYASQYIRHFHFNVARGSTSRGGRRALHELKRAVGEGLSPVITLDGPRGPRYEVQAGAAVLSKICGVPLIPLSLNAPRRWELSSWDRMQIPKPFAKMYLCIGKPFTVPPQTVREDRQEACRLIREAMLEITDDTMA